MNIEFTINAKSFLDAAEIEEYLQSKGIQYSVDGKLNGKRVIAPRPPSVKSSKRKKRVTLSKSHIRAIVKDRKMGVDKLVRTYGVSRSTITRVLSGTHTLQQK